MFRDWHRNKKYFPSMKKSLDLCHAGLPNRRREQTKLKSLIILLFMNESYILYLERKCPLMTSKSRVCVIKR